tara:strand:+ start:59 stop:238 length:180 start_codon:yes stop_codon:yes gene_type:complete
MNIQEINDLVEKFPNNMQLGEAVRTAYWKARKEETKNAAQLDLFESEDEKRDDAILGYD